MMTSDDPDPVMMTLRDLDWVMIQIHSSDDDPDRVMIQIERWSRSEDEDDLKTKMIQLIQRRRPVLKIVSKEYLPS